MELPRGDPDHAPACGLERAVSLAVLFEGGAGVMRCTCVEFDDEPLLRPDEVAFVTELVDVGAGSR